MSDAMTFPANPLDFIKEYMFKDDQQVYTNGANLISVLRVKQMLDHYGGNDCLYFCDPEKNVHCSKLTCYLNGGSCYSTACKEYEKEFDV